MGNAYETLCERIRKKCQHESWYGPELRHPLYRPSIQKNDPQHGGFVYAPATEEQIQRTEAALGFPLPSLLKALYTGVANGGFGPDYGIYGAIDGCMPTIVDVYRWRKENTILVGLNAYRGAWETDSKLYLELSHDFWLEQLFSLSEQGCARETCMDRKTGKLFTVAPFSNETYGIYYLAASLEDWLEGWLQTPLLKTAS